MYNIYESQISYAEKNMSYLKDLHTIYFIRWKFKKGKTMEIADEELVGGIRGLNEIPMEHFRMMEKFYIMILIVWWLLSN